MFLTLSLIIIIIILILLIVNQFVNNFADNHSFLKSKEYDIESYNLPDLQVKKIGICFSITTYLPYEIYSLGHEDLICYCSDGNWYLIAEVYDKDDIYGKTKHKIGIRKIDPIKKSFYFTFIFNHYKYRCFKLYTPNDYVNLKFVYNMLRNELKIPYHILKNNCHHMNNRVLNVVIDRKNKFNITELEPLNYLNKTIQEIYNDQFEEL